MGFRTSILIMTAERKDITLPIIDWLDNDNGIWRLFEDAKEGRSSNTFYISGKSGRHHQDILKVTNRCNLNALNFLDLDILAADGTGTILQSTDLLAPIRCLTIVVEELLKATDSLYCLPVGQESSTDSMLKAWENSEIDNDVDLDYYEEEGLFVILKALLLSTNDALVNNKVFIYMQWTV